MTTETVSVNTESNVDKKKAKKLAKKEAASATSMESVITILEPSGDSTLNVEGDDSPRKNQYAEVIAKKLRTLKKKLTKIETTEKLDKTTLNTDQMRMLDQKNEVVTSIKEYEEMMTHISRIEQEELKANVKKQAESVRETQKQIASAVSEARRVADEDIQSVLKLFYVFGGSLTPDVRITTELSDAIGHLRAILLNDNHDSSSDYLAKTTPHMTEFLSKSQNILTSDTSYEAVMEAINILLTPPPPSMSPVPQQVNHQPQFSPLQANSSNLVSFVAAPEEDVTGMSGHVIMGMPPLPVGIGGVITSNLTFFAPSEVTGEDPYQPPLEDSKIGWGDMPIVDVTTSDPNHGAASEPRAWTDDTVNTNFPEGQADSAVVEGPQPPFTNNFGGRTDFRGRGRGGPGGYRGDRNAFRGDRNGYRGERGFRGRYSGVHRGRPHINGNRAENIDDDGGEWQMAGNSNYSHNGYQEGRGGYRGGRGRGGGFRGNRSESWQEGPPRGRGRGGYNNQNYNNEQQQQ